MFLTPGIMPRMQTRTLYGLGIVALALLVALLQALATAYFLYWEFWWYDVMMHFLGGAFIGASYLWALYFELPLHSHVRIPVFISAFVVVLGVGIAWEIFEYLTDSYAALNYTLDTSLDLLMDMAGMMAAYLVFKRL